MNNHAAALALFLPSAFAAEERAGVGRSPTNLVSPDILGSKSHEESTMPCERIEMNPDIMDGKPVVRGTRVPVELVLRKLGAGMSPAAILVDHPRLTLEDIHAALCAD
jgi:uncharacterized protein (DUF433 family)